MKTFQLFDLDNTLTSLDTSTAFIYHLVRDSLFEKIRFFYYLILDGLRFLSFKKYQGSILNRFSNHELKLKSNKFVKEMFRNNRIRRDLIKLIKRSEKESILISNGIPVVVEEMAKKMGIKFVVTKNNGTIDKYRDFRKHYPKAKYEVYTDNFEDIRLIKNSEAAIIFVYNYKQRKQWKQLLKKNTFSFYRPPPHKPTVTRRDLWLTYFPGLYYFISRTKDAFWINSFLKEILPVFILLGDSTIYGFIKTAFFYYMVIVVYEFGIINNDYKSIKKEQRPTLRLERGVKINLPLFYALRIFVLSMFVLLSALSIKLKLLFLLIASLLLVTFWFHNNIQKQKRKVTFVVLRTLKALLFVMLALDFWKALIGFFTIMGLEHIKSFIKYFRDGYDFTYKENIVFTTLVVMALVVLSAQLVFKIYVLFVLFIFYVFTVTKYLDRFILISR